MTFHDFMIGEDERVDPDLYIHPVRCRRCGFSCFESMDDELLLYDDAGGYTYRYLTQEEGDCDLQLAERIMNS